MAIIHTGTTERQRPELARAVVAYNPPGMDFIAGRVLGEFPSQVDRGSLRVIKREDLASPGNTTEKVAPGAAYPRGSLRTANVPFNCEKDGQESQITDEDRAKYKSVFDAEVMRTREAMLKVMIRREMRVAAMVLNTTTWTGASLYTDWSGAPWDAVGSDAIGHILGASETVRSNTGVQPNALILGAHVLSHLLANTAIAAQFPGAAVLTRALLEQYLPAIFGLDYLLVGRVAYSSAKEGQVAAMADIWGDDYAMVARVAVGPDEEQPCIGRTVRWANLSGDGLEVVTYREPQTDSDIVKARESLDEIIIDAYFGHLMLIDA